ncbi:MULTISPECIES: DUF2290 domain-containing protein [unclassified Curtobacterium]|uniref:DUF2290 domain-containing protein n=1 Tax=unclassified Curtobacterium TaxID=257496 RepID=UPI003A810B05
MKTVGGKTFVTTSNPVDATTLRARSYEDLYATQAASRIFNVVFLDKALLQISYEWSGGALSKHRLAFLPSPHLFDYQNEPELYLGEHLWADIVGRQQVAVPLRFDFDREAADGTVHPATHLTLGQYRHCRIPVNGPVTPAVFVGFLLRQFYSTPEFAPAAVDYDLDRRFELSTVDHSGELHMSSPGNR